MIYCPLLWLLQKPVSNNQALKENSYLVGYVDKEQECRQECSVC